MRKRLTVSRGLVLNLTRSELRERIGLKADGWTFQWVLPQVFTVTASQSFVPQSIARCYRPAVIESVTPNGVIVRITLSTRTYVRYRS